MTYFITIAGRRWPVETTFETGKDVFGWDQTQVRSRDGICLSSAGFAGGWVVTRRRAAGRAG